MSELPPGWVMTTISNITAYLSRGKQPKYASYSSLPVINQRAIRWFGIQSEYLKYVDPAQFDQWEPERFIQAGDILWNSTGTGTLGRACLIKPYDLEPPKVVDSHVTIIRPNQTAIDPHFLFSWIQSSEVQEKIASLATGATNQIELSRATIASMRIPIAPLKEQKEIANKLDSLLARVDSCRDRLDRVPRILKHFRQSVLAAATSGELTEDWREEDSLKENRPVNWNLKIFGELVENSLYGPRFSAKNYSADGIPTIRTTDMDFDGTIVLRDTPRVLVSSQDFEKWGLIDGDLLITRTGSTIGKCAIYQKSIGAAIPGAYLIRFRLNQHDVIPKFVLMFLLSPQGQSLLVGGSTSVAQPNVNAKNISQFLVPIPPLSEQREIVRRVEDLFAYVERLEVRHQNAFRRVEQITSVLLSTAFRGELVPQDPSDEPAAVLLERIRAEQLTKPKRVVVNRKPKMPKMTEESVKEVIRQLPLETFSFDELREKISGDYDSFKDILFTLLSEAEPILTQVFDQEVEAMCFVRGDK